ncbi:hypothetical protein, partial [Salmonella enterica]|uniref:hypothetical protein n=1 Tax=Salmonella enterica TaxID=28901 RepID=UPI0019D6F9FE
CDCCHKLLTVHDITRVIGLFHFFIKPASAVFCFYRAAVLMTVHDAIPKRKRLIGQFHFFIKPASAGLCFYRAAG